MKSRFICDIKNLMIWGTWVVQSVRRLTLVFGSSGDLRVMRLSPVLDAALNAKSALPLPLPFTLSLSKINLLKKN